MPCLPTSGLLSNSIIQENIIGIRVVKSFVRGEHEIDRFERSNMEYARIGKRTNRYASIMGPGLNLFLNFGVVIVVWLGGLRSIHGKLSTGQIVAFVNYLQTAVVPLMNLVHLSNIWAAASASAKRINGVLEIIPEVQDVDRCVRIPKSENRVIRFESVDFRYTESASLPVLRGIDLSLGSTKTLAILGATGSGKSTLAHLALRFYDPKSGRVSFNAVDVRDIARQELLSHIAFVPQDTLLFSGTVRNNIQYGRPLASDEETVAAAQAAQAHDFILSLPQGYETRVEERGVNLSGGQKQRIAIARALLVHPDILVLDDATSSVDFATEALVHVGIKSYLPSCAILIIAQRISTVIEADEIVLLEEGRIVARGKHRGLMESSDTYREIYESQLGDG